MLSTSGSSSTTTKYVLNLRSGRFIHGCRSRQRDDKLREYTGLAGINVRGERFWAGPIQCPARREPASGRLIEFTCELSHLQKCVMLDRETTGRGRWCTGSDERSK